jgi:hypothetical protein
MLFSFCFPRYFQIDLVIRLSWVLMKEKRVIFRDRDGVKRNWWNLFQVDWNCKFYHNICRLFICCYLLFLVFQLLQIINPLKMSSPEEDSRIVQKLSSLNLPVEMLHEVFRLFLELVNKLKNLWSLEFLNTCSSTALDFNKLEVNHLVREFYN